MTYCTITDGVVAKGNGVDGTSGSWVRRGFTNLHASQIDTKRHTHVGHCVSIPGFDITLLVMEDTTMRNWLKGSCHLINFFKVYLFILRETDTVHQQGRVRERETKNPKQVPHCQHRL